MDLRKKTILILATAAIVFMAVAPLWMTPTSEASGVEEYTVHIDASKVRRAWTNPVFVSYICRGAVDIRKVYACEWRIYVRMTVGRRGITSISTDLDLDDPISPTLTHSHTYTTYSATHRRVTWVFKDRILKSYWSGYDDQGRYGTWYNERICYLLVRIDANGYYYCGGFSTYAKTFYTTHLYFVPKYY